MNAEGVYVASRASIPARGAMWRGLEAAGMKIISSWIHEDGVGQTESMRELWVRIEQEVAASWGLILYVNESDLPLKGALVEVGMALARRKPVVVVTNIEGNVDVVAKSLGSWVNHDCVAFARTPEFAYSIIESKKSVFIPVVERQPPLLKNFYVFKGGPVAAVVTIRAERHAFSADEQRRLVFMIGTQTVAVFNVWDYFREDA